MKLAVIIGSVREGRISDRVAKWAASEAEKHADVEILDLKDYPMPFFDEAISPRYNPDRQPVPSVKKWLDKMAEFDGYVVVTPEYNRSTSGVLKNAIDYLDHQMETKPVALIGHGSSGGAQAIANLRMAFPGVGAITVPQALFFSQRVGEILDEEGTLAEQAQMTPGNPQAALEPQMKSLVWYAEALQHARAKA